jgi:hypothetical protein
LLLHLTKPCYIAGQYQAEKGYCSCHGNPECADGELGLAFSQCSDRATVGALRARWASHSRQSKLERSIYAVLIVWLGDASNRVRTCCSLPKTTLRSTLIMRPLASLVKCSINQIRINDSFWIPGPSGFARWLWRNQLMKQFAQYRFVMGQFI